MTVVLCNALDERRDLVVRPRVECRECLATGSREAEVCLTTVTLRTRLFDERPLLEAPENSAQVAGVDCQFAGELGRGDVIAMGQLVHDAHFSERERAIDVALAQDPDVLRIKAIEAA